MEINANVITNAIAQCVWTLKFYITGMIVDFYHRRFLLISNKLLYFVTIACLYSLHLFMLYLFICIESIVQYFKSLIFFLFC